MQKKKPSPTDLNVSFGTTVKSSVIAQFSPADVTEIETYLNDAIPVIPIRDSVCVPDLPQPVKLDSDLAYNTATEAFKTDMPVFFVTLSEAIDNPTKLKDFYKIGVIGKIAKIVKLPDGSQVAFVSTYMRGTLEKIVKKKPFLWAHINSLPAPVFSKEPDMEVTTMLETLMANSSKIMSFLPEDAGEENFTISVSDPIPVLLRKLYGLTISLPLLLDEKMSVLYASTIEELIETQIKSTDIALQRLSLQAAIHMRTHENISSQQKEQFLKQQIKTIQEELGDTSFETDVNNLKTRASEKKWSRKTREFFDKELKKLEKLMSSTPEYSLQFSYLETFLDLPWENYSTDDFSLAMVEKVLDRDHYGMEKVKERIIEQMAVIKLRNDLKAPIICLYGPPGVGKTSLGKSIAEALGREYARVSLGGLHDEAEIRGHRRTYIGAMPGRIISSLTKCGTGNPVFVLDEIDKIRKDFKGDPSTALLEVLDPEQNSAFHDNYVDFDYDLSKVLFIATANDLGEISAPLRDRMEVIEISGYIPAEKIEIAKRHLIPKVIEANGFEKNEISFDKNALAYIIDHYTRESGVRELEKKLSKIVRKIARNKASGKPFNSIISLKKAKELLGVEEITKESYEGNDYAGVVTGLAWTQTGGEILFIETSLSPGKGEKLTLTGNLGDVMKESAVIAMEYIKAHATELNIDPGIFEKVNVHVHVPEGAVPKDGPSAGITIATSLISAFTGNKVKDKLAMTGEITLRGKVLPVGGIKEKILAAKRAGITDIVISKENKRHIEDINPVYLKGLNFHYVETINDVVKYSILDEKAPFRFNI